jgi:hypothetical protein
MDVIALAVKLAELRFKSTQMAAKISFSLSRCWDDRTFPRFLVVKTR